MLTGSKLCFTINRLSYSPVRKNSSLFFLHQGQAKYKTYINLTHCFIRQISVGSINQFWCSHWPVSHFAVASGRGSPVRWIFSKKRSVPVSGFPLIASLLHTRISAKDPTNCFWASLIQTISLFNLKDQWFPTYWSRTTSNNWIFFSGSPLHSEGTMNAHNTYCSSNQRCFPSIISSQE